MTTPRSRPALLAALLLGSAVAARAVTFTGPTSSQPIALDAAGTVLAVVNPDNDNVSLFDVSKKRSRALGKVAVQDEPWGVVVLPDASKIYVANSGSDTVSVLTRNGEGKFQEPTVNIPVGTEPYGLALTPNGTRLFVTNARAQSVSVIDTTTDAVVDVVPGVGFEPRGLAITNDGDENDDDEIVFVTDFLATTLPGELDGADGAKAGHLTAISTATNSGVGTVTLAALEDTGFNAAGDALARVPPGDTFTFVTGAYPNQLNGIAIHGDYVYVPNTGASPNGPVRFDVNTQSLISVANVPTQIDAGQTINLNVAVQNQPNPKKRFLTVPWALAFEHKRDQGWVVSAASDVVAKIAVDPATGAVSVPTTRGRKAHVVEVPTGMNPRGIVVDAADRRAYVMNYVSRDVTVIDVKRARALRTLPSESIPDPTTVEGRIHIGKELYNTSIGTFDRPKRRAKPIVGRMSKDGWGSCSSCHPFGLSDGVVWIFPSGPRRTIPQHTDFDQTDDDRSQMRPLGWSGIFDEQTDLELYVRNVSGGAGLLVQDDGTTPEANVPPLLGLANTGRRQLTVRGANAWDAIELYVKFGIRAPRSPVSKTDPDAVAGRALFAAANCQACHGSGNWTTGRIRFTPPPDETQVGSDQLKNELRQVGTFDPGAFNQVRDDGTTPLGADGFAMPSLLSVGAFPGPFLHDGSAATLDDVLNNVTHRSAGTSGVDTLSSPADRAAIIRFLQSIDAATTPFP